MKPYGLKGVRTTLAAAAGALLLGTAVSALAGATDEPLATLYVANDEVWWDPTPELAGANAVLTVSAPNGEVTTNTFAAGSQPFYAVSDDGVYTYEIYGLAGRAKSGTAGGSEKVLGSTGGEDANGRPLGASPNALIGGAAGSPQTLQGTVQSGYFSVVGGVPVDPSLQEG